MKLPFLLSLSGLWLAAAQGFAENADDYFHGGAVNYLSNNIPKALEVVTNGRALFPDDIKLKKLEELLKRQDQQQPQQQDKQDRQSGGQQQQRQDQQPQKPEDEQKAGDPQERERQEKPSDEQQREAQAMPAGQMTPEQAKQLLDSVKGDERPLIFRPEQKPEDRARPMRDW